MARDDQEKRYLEPVQRKKEVVGAAMDHTDRDQRLRILRTGSGKGESSSALEMGACALGHGMRADVGHLIEGRDLEHALRVGVGTQRGLDL